MKRTFKKSLLPLALAAALAVPAAHAFQAPLPGMGAGHNFDNRPHGELASSLTGASPAQARAIDMLSSRVPELRFEIDSLTGATTTLMNKVGFLTRAQQGDTKDVALSFVRDNADLLGLSDDDVGDYRIISDIRSGSGNSRSAASSVRHIYLQQAAEGLPVYNGFLQINIHSDGRILSVNNAFVPNLRSSFNRATPAITAEQALIAAADFVGRSAGPIYATAAAKQDAQQTTELKAPEWFASDYPVKARLVLLPVGNETRLAWNFTLLEKHEKGVVADQAEFNVDAETGYVWMKNSLVNFAQYKVFARPDGIPVESPIHSTPSSPADGRVTLTDPWIFLPTPAQVPSPFGWHDTNGVAGAESTLTQGNNAISYLDTDNDSTPEPGEQPDGTASLSFLFPIDLATQAPSQYVPAAVTNQFYMVNAMHDILYVHGFNEANGNYQVNNYGRGGTGGDPVRGEAQDGSGTNNANFYPSADGVAGKMQMYIWTAPTPDRDGDFDNGIIAHEYGHGVSNRLIGPLTTSSCMQNNQQPGEGTSDWWALFLTHDPDFTGYPLNNQRIRGMGPYATNAADGTGPGIRTDYYDGDPAVNPQPYENLWTYASLAGSAIPHGVGEKWAQAYWEVTWALIDEHGYDKNLYNYTGTSADKGNIRASRYIIEGLRNTQCSPAFTHVRDGIVAAAAANYGGEDVCRIWKSFAAFGLGADAVGSPSTITPTNGFAIPASCDYIDANPTEVAVCAGTNVTFPLTLGEAWAPPVNLAVSGVPSPATSAFSPNPVATVPGASTLTISNTGGVATGTYPLTVTGTDGNGSHGVDLSLSVYSGIPTVPSPTAPADTSTDVATSPTFTWSAVSGAENYVLEVSTSPTFSTIAYSATVEGTSATPTTPLTGSTTYYWRVRATSPCGASTDSQVFSFTTLAKFCATPNASIPDNSQTGVSSTITIPLGGSITDLDVDVVASHTWPGDLIFTLTKDATSVVIIDRPGVPASTFGCSTDNVDATLDDASATPVETTCNASPPGIGGTLKPENPLSAFNGQNRAGTWTLKVTDNFSGDTGALTSWCLSGAVAGGGDDPYADVQPVSLGLEAAENGGTVSEPLTIANIGGGTLTWSIDEAETAKSASLPGTDATVTYTDRTTFLAAVDAGYYEEAFTGIPTGSVNTPMPFSSGGFNYSVFTQAGAVSGLYNGSGFVSTDNSGDQIAVTFTSGNVTAVGGNFWATDVDFNPTGTSIVATLNDGSTVTVPTSAASTFIGFTSDTPITSLTLDGPSSAPNDGIWATLDNLIVGIAGGGEPPLPEGCEDPTNIPWLSVSPTSGSTAGGGSSEVTVTADPTGLAIGTYDAILCVNVNTTQETVEVPVSLEVAVPSVEIFSDSFDGNDPPAFFEDYFDGYANGSNVHGQGGWKGWGNDSGGGATVTNAQASSLPHSINVTGDTDLIHEFSGVTSGKWKVTARQYIPSGFTGESYFILLSQYVDTCTGSPACLWAVQVNFTGGSIINEGSSGGTLSYVTDQWANIEVEFDLGANTQTFRYNGAPLYSGTWTAEQSGGSIAALGAIDLFANGASPVYYDNIKIVQVD